MRDSDGACRERAQGDMPVSPSSFRELDFAVARNLFGYAVIDAALILRERRGAITRWLPEVGRSCAEAGLLFAMETLRELQGAGAAPPILPSVGLSQTASGRVNVSIAWNASTDA